MCYLFHYIMKNAFKNLNRCSLDSVFGIVYSID